MSVTPLMKQYFSIKEKYLDSFVFFQVGDFFELFFDDAKKASALLSITLTKRGYHNGEDIPLCGVPSHMVEVHALKLVKHGHTVVICGQTEKAEVGKLVSRGVTQVLSPGTLTNDSGVECNEKSLIFFISKEEKKINIFIFEYITFSIEYVSYESDFLFKEKFLTLFGKRKPKEIFIEENLSEEVELIFEEYGINHKILNGSDLEYSLLKDWQKKYKIPEIFKKTLILFLEYISKYQNPNLQSDASFFEYENSPYLHLDISTQKHLEILENNFDGTSKNTLFSVLDKTSTTMGARLLKLWLIHPLQKIEEIKNRQNCVKEFLLNFQLSKLIRGILSEIGDLERLSGRITLKRAFYGDYQRLLNIIPLINSIKEKILNLKQNYLLSKIISNLWVDQKIFNYLSERIFQNKENNEDNLINPESDEKLKEFYRCVNSQNEILLNFEREENKKFGVADYLKVRYTPLYGYVFEISKTKDNILSLPSDYICVQTLSQKERYSTPRLKILETEILSAKDKYKERDKFLYNELQEKIYIYRKELMETAKALAELDVLINFSLIAQENNWCLPNIDSSSKLEIISGKHPVLDSSLKSKFIENSLTLSDEKSKGWIITGPNMGGKSTFMRQSALIVILAHAGSYVPAKSANIPILNSIYTRIGASDNVSLGKSTFYVEMEEAAKICSQSNEKSLVILDEIGRGTSTYDGISLAASILEFLSKKTKPFLLFATHYGELYNLISEDSFISWHHVGIMKNLKNEIKISYLIKEGASFDSMGIEMAVSVGMEPEVISLAKIYKKKLEKSFNKNEKNKNQESFNLNIFEDETEKKETENAKRFLEFLKTTDLDNVSPREIYNIIINLKNDLL